MRSKLNTEITCAVGGTTPNHTLTPSDGTLNLGEQAITAISMDGTDNLSVELAAEIDDKTHYLYVSVHEFSGSMRHVLVSDGTDTYTADNNNSNLLDGLTAWLDDGPKTSVTLSFEVGTESQFA